MSPDARLLVLVPPELSRGFGLAGVDTSVVTGPEEAESEVRRLLAEGERGVIGVYEPFLEGIDPLLRERLEISVAPVVLPLPTGLEEETHRVIRARLAARLQRAVGYAVTFGEPG